VIRGLVSFSATPAQAGILHSYRHNIGANVIVDEAQGCRAADPVTMYFGGIVAHGNDRGILVQMVVRPTTRVRPPSCRDLSGTWAATADRLIGTLPYGNVGVKRVDVHLERQHRGLVRPGRSTLSVRPASGNVRV
jgi:hypothetical protein